jgi:hypothetical protein
MAQPVLLSPGNTAGAVVPAEAPARRNYAVNKKAAPANLAHSFDVQFTSTGSDVLQAVGQVVLRKAVRAGWTELSSKLLELAGCDEVPVTLRGTCDVLGKARIEDLIASPRTLLDAFSADVLVALQPHLDRLAPTVRNSVVGLAAAWKMVGTGSVAQKMRPWLKEQLRVSAGQLSCPSDEAAAVAWTLGECYADGTTTDPMADLTSCAAEKLVDTCTFAADATANATARKEVVSVAELGIVTIDGFASSSDVNANRAHIIQLFFEWTKLADAKDKDLLASLEQIFLGFGGQDWTRAVVGLGRVADVINTKGCDQDANRCTIEMKLVRIVGAVGQFAATYSNKIDPSAAREKVIEDLVTSFVARSERDHGAVISLGGALALFGGARLNDSGYQVGMPVRLTLGLGFQTYSAKERGLHASFDVFDLGQYVSYSQNTLDVGSPDIKSSIIAGATLGYWFTGRETPTFISSRHGSLGSATQFRVDDLVRHT